MELNSERAGLRRASNSDVVVLATRNKGKIAEMRELLLDLSVQLLTETDLAIDFPKIEEDAETLEGNARKKADTVFALTGLPALADDTGLEVRSLDGSPGVHSARYAGDDCDAGANRRRLLDELQNHSDRSARFRTVLALARPGKTLLFEGLCDGRITFEERGDGGFGYDAIFVPTGTDHTFAEMTAAEKNRVSHRARALEKLRAYLEAGGPE